MEISDEALNDCRFHMVQRVNIAAIGIAVQGTVVIILCDCVAAGEH